MIQEQGEHSDQDLFKIAKYQKESIILNIIILCCFIYIGCFYKIFGDNKNPPLYSYIPIVFLIISYLRMLVVIFKFADSVGEYLPLIWTIAFFLTTSVTVYIVPTIIWGYFLYKANKILKANNIAVGLFGVKKIAIDKLIETNHTKEGL